MSQEPPHDNTPDEYRMPSDDTHHEMLPPPPIQPVNTGVNRKERLRNLVEFLIGFIVLPGLTMIWLLIPPYQGLTALLGLLDILAIPLCFLINRRFIAYGLLSVIALVIVYFVALLGLCFLNIRNNGFGY